MHQLSIRIEQYCSGTPQWRRTYESEFASNGVPPLWDTHQLSDEPMAVQW